MQHRTLCIFALTALGGCATVTPWPEVSAIDVCYQTLYGNPQNRSGAEGEASRRGLDCRPYYPAIIAREQQRSQALQNAADYFRPRPAPPMMIQPPTVCRTAPSGNGYQTICN